MSPTALLFRRVLKTGAMFFLFLGWGAEAQAATPTQLKIEAESEVQNAGVVNYGSGISYVDNGDWVRYANVDFGTCAFYQSFSALIATPFSGNLVHVRLDGLSGREVATLTTVATGTDWQNFSLENTQLLPVTGVHDLYLVFDGSPNSGNAASSFGNGIGNFDWIQLLSNFTFPASSSTTCNPVDVLNDRMTQLSTEIANDTSQMVALRLQMAQNQQSLLVTTLSNILKVVTATSAAIIQNVK
jgi:Carbohydrate binding module (family 6)